MSLNNPDRIGDAVLFINAIRPMPWLVRVAYWLTRATPPMSRYGVCLRCMLQFDEHGDAIRRPGPPISHYDFRCHHMKGGIGDRHVI